MSYHLSVKDRRGQFPDIGLISSLFVQHKRGGESRQCRLSGQQVSSTTQQYCRLGDKILSSESKKRQKKQERQKMQKMQKNKNKKKFTRGNKIISFEK